MSDLETKTSPSGATVVIVWTLSLLTGFFYLAMAYQKLIDHENTVAAFALWGHGTAFMHRIAWIEVIGGIALLVPRLTTWGAALLAIEMIGATFTILSTGTGLLPLPLICLVVLGILGWQRRDLAIGLPSRRSV
jgi:putative oxidoreductase